MLKDLIEHGAVRHRHGRAPGRPSRRPRRRASSSPSGARPRGPRGRARGRAASPIEMVTSVPDPSRPRSTARRSSGSGRRWRPGPGSTTRGPSPEPEPRARPPTPTEAPTSEDASRSEITSDRGALLRLFSRPPRTRAERLDQRVPEIYRRRRNAADSHPRGRRPMLACRRNWCRTAHSWARCSVSRA